MAFIQSDPFCLKTLVVWKSFIIFMILFLKTYNFTLFINTLVILLYPIQCILINYQLLIFK